MKKIVSILLTAILISGSISFIYETTAKGATAEISAEEFASEVSELVNSAKDSSNLPADKPYSCEDCSHKDFENSRLIVKSKYKIDTLDSTAVINGYDDLWILQFSTPHSAHEAFEYYNKISGIEYVEPDKSVMLLNSEIQYINPLSEEEKEYLCWASEYVGFDKLNESLITNIEKLEDTIVAVVDSGVDPDHPLLKGRVIPTRINTSLSGKRNDSSDDLGHGTQVAGIIADNTIGKVYIKPYKVIDYSGHGTVITVASGINCAVDDNVDVINISIGFEEDSEVLKAAIENAESKGITVVAAAGNDGSDTVYYPASYPTVIKVSAVNNMGIIANFSTRGNGVDFAAPGVGIVTSTLNNKYLSVNGTSFASPYVAAAAASVLLINHHASPEDVSNILSFYTHMPGEFNAEENYGMGIIKVPIYADSFTSLKKTEAPYFSQETKFYYDPITIEIYCDTPDSVIYYTTDGSMPTKTNPDVKIYDGTPLHFDQTIKLSAVAYSSGNFRSEVSSFYAIIAPYAQSHELTVDSDGTVLSYSGSKKSISIPETVSGITITGIGNNVFKSTDMTEVILPKNVKSIGFGAFEGCKKLRTVYGINVESIGDRAFYDCENIRNLFFGSISEIGSYSFYNAGSKEYLVYGRTFTLNLEKLRQIPDGAFMGSSISSVELNKISSIGKNAFADCHALVSIYAKQIDTLPDGTFKGLKELSFVSIDDLSYIPSATFSTCEKLIFAEIPNATFVNSNAFENCSSLELVDLSSAETVFSNAFNGCSNLNELNLPSMKGFNDNVYIADNPNILLPANLVTFKAEKMEKTVRDMFTKCRNIENIYLNSATQINEYTFRGCHNIFFLNIENVKTLNENALAYCTAEFIDARSLESTASLPDNSGILLSNNFYESTDVAENLTVYGTPDTFVERYALKKGYNFIGIPMIYNEIPEYITQNSETVHVDAIGFNLEYQWFYNTVNSTEGGTPIDGATSYFYTFTKSDTAPFYYCQIKQTDMEKVSYITTDIIIKDTTLADYTEYEKAVKEAKEINRIFYENIYILDEALSVDVYGRYSCEQDVVDAQTQAIRDAIANLITKGVKSITLRSSETELKLFENIKIMPEINPFDAQYGKIEWYTDNEDVVLVNKNGNVICIGDGDATVFAKVINPDGSAVIGSITFYCDLTTIEKIAGFLFGSFVKIAYMISMK